ncbi:MAG: hypothetical protein R2724_09055 [Bryobacterales bacterium]
MRFAAAQLRADGKDASVLEPAAAFEGTPSGRLGDLPFWLGLQTLLLTSSYDLRKRVNRGRASRRQTRRRSSGWRVCSKTFAGPTISSRSSSA